MKQRLPLLTILALFLLLAIASWSAASAREVGTSSQAAPDVQVLYVNPGGSGSCASWADACELQTALLAAGPGCEVWVQAGVYRPTTGTTRTVSFALESGVALYGGFAGAKVAA